MVCIPIQSFRLFTTDSEMYAYHNSFNPDPLEMGNFLQPTIQTITSYAITFRVPMVERTPTEMYWNDPCERNVR